MASSATVHAGKARPRVSRAADPIIASKLALPSLPEWFVSRPRLEKQINEGVQGPLTLVSGPPGAGKTMAAASWAADNARQLPIAWVALDEYDNRPRAFWSYVVEALRCAGVGIPRTVWASGRSRGVDYGFILSLTAAIAAHGSPVILVLDDLHLVTERRSLDALVWLLRNARPHLHLVVTSRSDPLLPLHRYRLAGELTEIRADELAFRIDEASLLVAHHGITLPAESLEFLTARVDGWAAALRLAAISMQTHPDPEQFVKEVAAEDSGVASYLVEEVLSTLPVGVRRLLLRTSILDRVSAGLAGELAGPESAIDLPALAQATSLIQPVGGGWYRYHTLLAEVLRLKLQRESPGVVPDLHRRAAGWLRRNGTLAEAARHAAAVDWELAARIVIDELAVDQLIAPPGSGPLAEVLRHMPRSQAWSKPQPLLVTAALGLSGAAYETVDALLAVADSMLEQVPPDAELPSRLARAMICLVRARRHGDLGAAQAAVADAAALVGRIPADQLARRPGVSARVMAGRGSVELWSGHFDQAAVTLRAAAAECGAGKRADCLGHLALLEALRGRLSRAAELALQTIGANADDQARTSESASRAALVTLAYVHLERGELHEARRWLRHVDEALQLCPDKIIGAVACLVAARGCLAEDRAGPVPELLGRALRGWSPPPWLERAIALVESQALTAEGNTQSSVDAARRAGAGSSPEATAALARAWLAAGDVKAAKDAFAGGSTAFDRAPDQIRLQAWLIDARISHVMGDRERAHRSLEHALRLGDTEQLRLPFVMERAWIGGALQRSPDLAHGYGHLLDPVPGVGDGSTRTRVVAPRMPSAVPSVPGQAMPLIVERLSDREREVLQHVSQLMGTAEIAAEMFVSTNTVKSHLKSIFRKLGAASRNEAVRRARQLQLI
jgi:LuxR family transcriptional regulator, maltose regulon positive regulatory protein